MDKHCKWYAQLNLHHGYAMSEICVRCHIKIAEYRYVPNLISTFFGQSILSGFRWISTCLGWNSQDFHGFSHSPGQPKGIGLGNDCCHVQALALLLKTSTLDPNFIPAQATVVPLWLDKTAWSFFKMFCNVEKNPDVFFFFSENMFNSLTLMFHEFCFRGSMVQLAPLGFLQGSPPLGQCCLVKSWWF